MIPTAPRALLVAVGLIVTLSAIASGGAAGDWSGRIEVPEAALDVRVALRSGDDGWRGTIDIPVQGARDLPLEGVTIEGATVRFAIAGIPGAPTFSGALDADRIAGTFTQGGASFPFVLERRPAPDGDRLAGFDALVERVRTDWNVPGIAVAIVEGDRVLSAKGHGFRDVEAKAPVGPDTVFAIGSATKAFTTFVLATLVEEGKLAWDDRVREHVPAFALHDPVAAERMTVRDLVTHRSGLPRHDLMWYGSPWTREELVDRLRWLEPSGDLRESFQYQNLMYVTAGLLAGRVAESTWEDLVRGRILGPLGMRSTTLTGAALAAKGDVARPYRVEGEDASRAPKRIPPRRFDAMGPAGTINSTASDMARWVRLQLAGGEFEGRRLLSAARLAEMHDPQIVVGKGSILSALLVQEETPYLMYGFGWFVQPYRGRRLVHHGGNIDGYSAFVAMLPEDDLGVVVLTNSEGNRAGVVLAFSAFDRLLGVDPPTDWNARYLASSAQLEQAAKAADEAREIERKKGTHSSRPLTEFAGEYEHPAYGPLSVDLRNGALVASFHGLESRLEHWHYDVFRTTDAPFEGLTVAFRCNPLGDIRQVSVSLEQAVAPIVFDRRPPAGMSAPAFLESFVGEYDLMGQTVIVAKRRDGRLTVEVPGQPVYTLVPYGGTRFEIDGLDGYSVRFEVEKMRAVEAVFVQPNGVFRAKRKPDPER